MTLDKYLDLLAKQNYLEKTKIMGPGGNEEGATIEWRWGSREAEFSEQAASLFIENVQVSTSFRWGMVDLTISFEEGQDESEDEGEGQQGRRARRDREAEKEAKKKRLRKDIVKAAGGDLRD